jgi:UDP-glucose 4-epimerase
MDNLIVKVVDEAPTSVCELSRLIRGNMNGFAAPLVNPWFGQLIGSLARRLGF